MGTHPRKGITPRHADAERFFKASSVGVILTQGENKLVITGPVLCRVARVNFTRISEKAWQRLRAEDRPLNDIMLDLAAHAVQAMLVHPERIYLAVDEPFTMHNSRFRDYYQIVTSLN